MRATKCNLAVKVMVILLLSHCWVPGWRQHWWLGDSVSEQGHTSPSKCRYLTHYGRRKVTFVRRALEGRAESITNLASWGHLGCPLMWNGPYVILHPNVPRCPHGHCGVCRQGRQLCGIGNHWLGISSIVKRQIKWNHRALWFALWQGTANLEGELLRTHQWWTFKIHGEFWIWKLLLKCYSAESAGILH